MLPHLCTYPRSGSHYFDDLLYEELNIHFNKSHYVDQLFDKDNNKIRTIVTIVRDPIDSISSYLALINLQDPMRDFIVFEKITEYVLLYSFLYEHADYVIDFNDLVKSPDSVIKKIITLIDINENDYDRFHREFDPKFKGFVPSSKSLPEYNKNVLDGYNVDLCYFYYYKLLEKKIII